MKNAFVTLAMVILLGSCSIFQPRIPYQMGMSESKFLRQNRSAVISNLNGEQKIYRVNTEERFYMLATFENGILVNLEEREIAPVWPQQQRIMQNN